MSESDLRRQAQREAGEFLEKEGEYRIGFVEAEQPHPLTRRFSQTAAASPRAGVELLLQVDRAMARRAEKALAGEEFARFADAVRETILAGGRVVFSGCGSSGRLSMQLERSWRFALARLIEREPELESDLLPYLDSVENIMTGGDWAVIRSVESFEDSPLLGKAQAKERRLSEKDLLVGVTATGETTSVLGSAMGALEDGAGVYMLICADPAPLLEKLSRAREVYTHPRCRSLTLPCGPMALTGSTRMQSSTFEQLAGAVALEGALADLLRRAGKAAEFPGYARYGREFSALTEQLLKEKSTALLEKAVLREEETYQNGGLVTYFAGDYLLDVLTDTTERAPTFTTPPFRAEGMEGPPSPAFVKHPFLTAEKAWELCFLREPHCIEWEKERYRSFGFSEEAAARVPDLSAAALKKFDIGSSPDPERENSPLSLAVWVDAGGPIPAFDGQAERYARRGEVTLSGMGVAAVPTAMNVFEHLGLKMALNALSTCVMARLGRVTGNWMTCLALSNKKLTDRSARIVADQCGVPYEKALEEVFYSRALLAGKDGSPAADAIRRLGVKGE